jgi:hypothetical protein
MESYSQQKIETEPHNEIDEFKLNQTYISILKEDGTITQTCYQLQNIHKFLQAYFS